MSFSDQELEEFKVEALELLDVAEKSLLALDEGAEFRSSFDAIFRGFHNLKGAAGMMELVTLQSHTHELENMLMKFQHGSAIPGNYISFFLRGIDAAKSILNGDSVIFDFTVENTEEVPNVCDEFFSESEECIERISQNLHLLESKSYSQDDVDALYRDIHTLKGSSYLFSFSKLGNLAHAMESSLEKVRDGICTPSPQLLDCLFKSLGIMETVLERIKKCGTDADFEELISTMCQALSLIGSRLQSNNVTPILATPVKTPVVPPSEGNSEGNSTIRVPVSLLDNLMTLVGEMVLVRNQVLQFSNSCEDTAFLSMSKRLNVVTSEIQGEMMKTRMQPIGNVISKFNRVVRDLSQELNKNINLILQGAETELDKSLLETIKDPLTHIVRNSCDHGIETPDQRRKIGKSETGTITIKAHHEGGQVVIEVSDDGKGLRRNVILNKAVERGLVTLDQGNRLSDKEVFQLIFAPGFSTAEKITNISGRGVGMDVVRTNIEQMGGTVELSGAPDLGTTIKIKIPLTLAIVPALIVRCGKGTFAIPQVKLEGLVRVDQMNDVNRVETLHTAPVFRLRGSILPLVDLGKLLGLEPAETKRDQSIINIAVLNAENMLFGVIIDEVKDTADIVVKPLNRLLKSLHVYSGATILGDGSVALIFDILGISKLAKIGSESSRIEELQEQKKVADSQDFLLFKVNSSSKHSMALSYVHRLEEFKARDIEYSGHRRVIRYRDVILPIVSANEQLGYEHISAKENVHVVVIKRAGKLFGLEVNEILDTMSTTIEVTQNSEEHSGIFGNLNTPSELIVVVNPFDLINKEYPESIDRENSYPSSNQKLLLVEDTVFFRRMIKSVLEERGYEVVVAHDGQEAWSILNSSPEQFDLVVSDIEMPRMNGLQLALNIRKTPKFEKLPLLAISSRADREYRSKGMSAGFDVYLEKLKPVLLLSAISELTKKRRVVA